MSLWSYFKPLRRKVGVVTLLLALALIFESLRSDLDYVAVTVPFGQDYYLQIASANQCLILGSLSIIQKVGDNKEHSPTIWMVACPEQVANKLYRYYLEFEVPPIDSIEVGLPFRADQKDSHVYFNSGAEYFVDYECFTVPYWSIVLPLALLSAWLLLSKVRTSKTKPTSEP